MRPAPESSVNKRPRQMPRRHPGPRGRAAAHKNSKRTFCGTALEFVALFLGQSSIHGLNHLVAEKRTLLERFVWSSIVVLAIFGSVWVSFDIWRHYDGSPSAISMERNFMDWTTDMPSGTLCPSDRVDEEKLEAYVDSLKDVEDKEKVKNFLRMLASATYENFKDMTDIPKNPIKSDEYLKAILEIRKDLHYQYFTSDASRDPNSVANVVSVTELGVCYTYNTRVAIYNNPDYWAQNNWSIVPYDTNKKLQGHPVTGPMKLNLIAIEGKDVMFYYHSPYDVLDASNTKVSIPEDKIRTVQVKALSTHTTAEAQALSIKQRKCRFPDENDLRTSPVYTFNFCRMECRRRIAWRKCKCIPHFYRKTGRIKVCDVHGMQCLGKYSELLTKLVDPITGRKYPCNCLPECDQVSFYLEEEDVKPNILKIGASVECGIQNYPRMRLKRDVIFGFGDLWVSIGGTGGLFLGCSVLSIIEIFYFFTIRLFIYILEIRRGTRPVLQQKPGAF
ncbi:pickpocket protein 28-like isoform X2 [Zootermopsis nevadensis]|uniref:pickpocket protein 28-like isoform X2 n=1 Tax=Zootermopsis nevadensis TaxID=136037 RepID=UPI000B8EC0D9|nr:pickpocket protein 28-like isoform X2 [Zootermopsis nevadensis]